MKWIKGFLIVGMLMLAHSTVSINDVEARTETAKKTGNKGKTAAKGSKAKTAKGSKAKTANKAGKKDATAKKGGLFSSFTAGLKKAGGKIKAGAKAVGSKIAAGAKAAKDKAGNAVDCRAGKGTVPGQELYAMAASGTQLTDNHVVAAHTTKPASKSGRKK